MNENVDTENTQPDTFLKEAFWALVIMMAIFWAIYISFSAYDIPHYPYYAATLDFQPAEPGEPPHDFLTWDDKIRWEEVGGAVAATTIVSPFKSTFTLLWVLIYCALGARRLLLHRQRLVAGILFVCAVLPWTAFSIAGLKPSPSIEEFYTNEYIRLTEKGTIIIDALETFHKDHNTYPDKLEQLVPQYLSKIPVTGIRVCPEFNYIRPEVENNIRQPYRQMNSGKAQVITYDLSVNLHKVRNHYAADMHYYLYYQPEQEYPHWHRKINQWAIVSSGWVRVP
jgi:hypothetical protein